MAEYKSLFTRFGCNAYEADNLNGMITGMDTIYLCKPDVVSHMWGTTYSSGNYNTRLYTAFITSVGVNGHAIETPTGLITSTQFYEGIYSTGSIGFIAQDGNLYITKENSKDVIEYNSEAGIITYKQDFFSSNWKAWAQKQERWFPRAKSYGILNHHTTAMNGPSYVGILINKNRYFIQLSTSGVTLIKLADTTVDIASYILPEKSGYIMSNDTTDNEIKALREAINDLEESTAQLREDVNDVISISSNRYVSR